MINNINSRYCAYIRDVSLDDPEAMEQMVRHTRIVRYSCIRRSITWKIPKLQDTWGE